MLGLDLKRLAASISSLLEPIHRAVGEFRQPYREVLHPQEESWPWLSCQEAACTNLLDLEEIRSSKSSQDAPTDGCSDCKVVSK